MVPEPFRLYNVEANDLVHRVATVRGYPPFIADNNNNTVTTTRKKSAPLVMLLHGWPESWYSWRHQLIALSKAGYSVCAPSMRGYGEKTKIMTCGVKYDNKNIQNYSIPVLCQDIIQIATVLGYKKIIVIGHDFGSWLAWYIALLHPTMVVGVCGMSVPYVGLSKNPPILQLQEKYGLCLPQSPYKASIEEQKKSYFHYMLYHNLPFAEEEYDKNCEEALYRIYSYHSLQRTNVHPNTPEVSNRHMFPPGYNNNKNNNQLHSLDARSAPGLWYRTPKPKSLPYWLPKKDFDYYVNEFQKHGFTGGLMWYRALDINWAYIKNSVVGDATTTTTTDKLLRINPQSLFICGDEDNVLKAHGGKNIVVQKMNKYCSNMMECVFYEGAGHWIQQERARDVNKELLSFLSQVVPLGKDPTLSSKL